jgi:hypothetical protein
MWKALLCGSSLLWALSDAFAPSISPRAADTPSGSYILSDQPNFVFKPSQSLLTLDATGSSGKKRKRRRRKDRPDQAKTQGIGETEDTNDDDDVEELSEEDIFQLQDVAKFEFDKDSAASMSK